MPPPPLGRYLGGWPQHARDLPPGRPSVVDVTCELPRSHNQKYILFRVWDTRGALPRSHHQRGRGGRGGRDGRWT